MIVAAAPAAPTLDHEADRFVAEMIAIGADFEVSAEAWFYTPHPGMREALRRFKAGIDLTRPGFDEAMQGRGKDLHDSMIRDLAVDYARTVFLKIENEVSKVTNDTVAEVYAWAKDFPYSSGVSFVESVSTTLQTFGANDTQRAAAETLAAHAYRDEMDRLFASEQLGGSA